MTEGHAAGGRPGGDPGPQARGPALGDVLLGAVGSLGVEVGTDGLSSTAAARRLDLPPARRACVVLVDGLGWHNLTERADLAPFLTTAGRLDRLGAAFPSTTATNLAFLGTGHQGGATGMLGYTVRDPAGRLLNMISWGPGVDPERWQRRSTVFELLEGQGRTAVSVGPWRFADSALTTAALRGGEYVPAETLAQRVDAALGALRDPGVDLVYLYWGDVDRAGHHHGWRSPEWSSELAHLDSELSRLGRLLPVGTSLLVTADHGMVDVPHGRSGVWDAPARLDVADRDDLQRGVELVAGEPRASHVYCRPGAADDVHAAWSQALEGRARVMTRAEVVDAGLLGPLDPRFENVVGDVVVAALGDLAVHDSRTQTAASLELVGMHGSTTPEETVVPLMVLEA